VVEIGESHEPVASQWQTLSHNVVLQQKQEEEEEESLPVALPVSTPDGDSEDTSRKSTGNICFW
jgi:hypothetical protein